MADFSLSDMPWLTQPIDYVGSMSRGIAAGSQIAHNSLARRSLDLQQAQQERQAAEDAVLLPLKIAGQIQENKMRDITLAAQWQTRQDMLDSAKAVTEASANVSSILRQDNPNYNHARAEVFDVIRKYPPASKILEPFLENIDKAEKSDFDLREARLKADTQKDIAAGKIPLERKTPAMIETEELERRQAAAGIKVTPALQVENFVTRTQLPGETTTITTDPKTGQVTFKAERGRGGTSKSPTDLTTVNITEAQKKLEESKRLFDEAAALRDLITPDTTGVIPMAKVAAEKYGYQIDELIGYPVVGQFLKSNPNRAITEVQLAEFGATILRALKSDSNIAEPERKIIESAGLSKYASAKNNREKAMAWQQVAAEHGRAKARVLGVPVPLEFLKPSELNASYKEALAALVNPTQADLDALNAKYTAALKASPYKVSE